MEGMYRFSCGGAYSAHGNTAMPLADQISGESSTKADFMSAVLAANSPSPGGPSSHVAPINTPIQFGDAFDIAVLGTALMGVLICCIGGCFVVSWMQQCAPPASQQAPSAQVTASQFGQPSTYNNATSVPVAPPQYATAVGVPAGFALAPAAALQYGQPFVISTGAALAPAAAIQYYQPPVVTAPPKSSFGQPESQPVQQSALRQPIQQPAVRQSVQPSMQQSVQPQPLPQSVQKRTPAPVIQYVQPISNSPAALGTMTTRTGYDAMGRVHTNAFR
jgi:hypothetical protein